MRAALLLLWPALIYAQNGTPKFAVLHGFSGENGDGAYPGGALLIGANGALYGTTARGGNANGISGVGMVFELTPPSSPGGAWTETAYNRTPDLWRARMDRITAPLMAETEAKVVWATADAAPFMN